MAPPSLYKHVAGLDDLLLRVTTLSVRRLTDRLAKAALGRSGRQALLAIAHAYRSYAVEHAGIYALTQADARSESPALRAEIARALEVLTAVVEGYRVPDDLSKHATRMVRAGLHGFADIEARGGFQLSHSVNESFDVLVDALDASLKRLGRRCPIGKR